MPYPVLTEVSLPPVDRAGLRRARREPRDLPVLRPGTVYVFRTHGGYVDYGERHVDYADAVVVDATEVSIVAVRPRQLPVDIAIPSTRPDHDFIVRTTFRCRVIGPAAVAETGLTDLDVVLASHLARDDELGSVGRSFDVASAHEVRRLVDAQVRAYCTVAPPDITGLEVTLVQVQLLVPGDIRASDEPTSDHRTSEHRTSEHRRSQHGPTDPTPPNGRRP